MLLKIPLSSSSHSLQKQCPFIPYRRHTHTHTQLFLQSAQSLLPLTKLKFKISASVPRKGGDAQCKAIYSIWWLIIITHFTFLLYLKAIVKGTSAASPSLVSQKTHVSLFSSTSFAKIVILGLHLEELAMSLVFCTDQNDIYDQYGLNRGKKCVVCVLRTALQGHAGEEEKMGVEMKAPRCRLVQLWV